MSALVAFGLGLWRDVPGVPGAVALRCAGHPVLGTCRASAGKTKFCLSLIDEDGDAAPPSTYGTDTSPPYDFDATDDGGFIVISHTATCPMAGAGRRDRPQRYEACCSASGTAGPERTYCVQHERPTGAAFEPEPRSG